MDPVTAVSQGVASIFGFLSTTKNAKYGRLPQYQNVANYNRKNQTVNAILIGLTVMVVLIIVAVIIVSRKK